MPHVLKPLPGGTASAEESTELDLLRAVSEGTPDPALVKDTEGRYLWVNQAFADLVSRPISDILGRADTVIFPSDEAEAIRKRDLTVMTSGAHESYEITLETSSGRRSFLTMKHPYRDAHNRVIGVVGICRDITERKLVEQAQRDTELRFRAFMENSPAAAFIKDGAGRYIYANAELLRAVKKDQAQILGKTDFDLFTPEDAEQNRAYDDEVRAAGCRKEALQTLLAPDGEPREWMVCKFPLYGNADDALVGGVAVDITERLRIREELESRIVELNRAYRVLATQTSMLAEANEKLKEAASTDGLTGVKNHRAFHEALAQQFAQANRYGTALSMIMVDIDSFKKHNDTHGHLAGDAVLKKVAQLLLEHSRESDLVARWGGEEFVVLLPATTQDGAHEMAERIRFSIESVDWEGSSITASLGVAAMTPRMRVAADLAAEADQALYWSKSRGRNRVSLFEEIATEAASCGERS